MSDDYEKYLRDNGVDTRKDNAANSAIKSVPWWVWGIVTSAAAKGLHALYNAIMTSF